MRNGENLYEIIAGNIRRKRKRLSLTQAKLAERADVSIDTVKSIETAGGAMSLDTYLKIVQALETSPLALMEPGTAGTVHRAFYFYDESV